MNFYQNFQNRHLTNSELIDQSLMQILDIATPQSNFNDPLPFMLFLPLFMLYKRFRIVYSRDFLIRCASSPYALLPPKDIRKIVTEMGDIVAHFPRRRPCIRY
ncbi:hypothetical protein niasHT_024993 [Heterodera trifolii]|uniref:Cytochrome P450 n=1 Tax=Heterodera trifolii TaxID=157864 RepID=A0ABD2KST0_9BILA